MPGDMRPFEGCTVTRPVSLALLTFPKSGPTADVRVGVAPRVVQVHGEHPGIRAVVPVAATIRKTSFSTHTPTAAVSGDGFDPAAYHAAYFVVQLGPVFVLAEVKITKVLCGSDL